MSTRRIQSGQFVSRITCVCGAFLFFLAGIALAANADASRLLLTMPAILAASSQSLHPPSPPISDSGRITYTISYADNQHKVFRINAEAGASPEDVSASLNLLSSVATPFDRMLNSSPNGEWLLLESNRFEAECVGWPCLALVKGDLSAGGAIRIDGNLIHVEGWSAVASSGNLIVYTYGGGTHSLDLWAIRRSDTSSDWGQPVNITAASSFPYNQQPSVSTDGNKIVFKCGTDSYDHSSICEVKSDGSEFRLVVSASQAGGSTFLNQPDYGPDGSIVFEEAENIEQIWRLTGNGASLDKITSQFSNDNAPCVLPDGRVVTLWVRNIHELKVMNADGSNYRMLVEGVDIADIGLGCGL